MTFAFKKEDRLLCPDQFRAVLARGKWHRQKPLSVVIKPNQERPRLGLALSRHVGNAVARNRLKLVTREWFRHQRHSLPAADFVIQFYKGADKK